MDGIKKDENGFIFDAKLASAFGQQSDWTDEQIQEYHPLFKNTGRLKRLQELANPSHETQFRKTVIDPNGPQFKAMNQMLKHNEDLLQKGADPKNPKDRKHFKKIPSELITGISNAVKQRVSGIFG